MKVISSVGMRSIIQELTSLYEAKNNTPIELSFGSSAMILSRIETGEYADLVILASSAMDTLLKQDLLLPSSCQSLASTGVGVSCRAATSYPDISTVKLFKQALVQANSIAYTTSGVSGIYFTQLLSKLDLSDLVSSKAVTLPEGQIARLLVNGSADLAIQLTSELVGFPGTEYIGPLPPELQMEVIFRAGIFTNSKYTEDALDFLQFVGQSELTPIYTKNGMNQIIN